MAKTAAMHEEGRSMMRSPRTRGRAEACLQHQAPHSKQIKTGLYLYAVSPPQVRDDAPLPRFIFRNRAAIFRRRATTQCPSDDGIVEVTKLEMSPRAVAES